MRRPRYQNVLLHAILIVLASLTLTPFLFTANNIFRTKKEFDQSFFSFPDAFEGLIKVSALYLTGNDDQVEVVDGFGAKEIVSRDEAFGLYIDYAQQGPSKAWSVLRPFMQNSFLVSICTAIGVCLVGSSTAYILSRYRFIGREMVFLSILSTMMFPAVLTLVPSFLLVKELGLLNSYWAMILPYIASGQVIAIFVFRSFFAGLPEELFESARIDGAGHLGIYLNIILPLSKPVFSVVIIMNVLYTWNQFLWPFIVNTDGSKHVIASGLFIMARSQEAQDFGLMFAAYSISSIPLLVLFIYATRPFMRGITSGALKA